MANSVKKVLDLIIGILLERLADEGFVAGGNLTLIRPKPEAVCAFNIQPDKYNKKIHGKFTVNLSLWYPELAAERGEIDDTVLKTGGLHLTQRLAMLAPAPPDGRRARIDTWWEVSESTDPQKVAATIYSLWEQFGRGWLAQNGTLASALPRVVRQWSEYHAATALYAAGDIAGAKEKAQAIWRGSHPGFPERIEWAWKRKLFDLADLRTTLDDEHHQDRIIAIDTLWKLARADGDIATLAGDLVGTLVQDPDPVVARHAKELRESLYIGDDAVRIIPRDVPALAKLSKNAAIAFGARCARRVQGNISRYWPAVKPEQLTVIAHSLETVEDIAAGKRAQSDARIVSKQLEPIRRAVKQAAEKSEEVALAESAVDSACWAAQAVTGGATAAEVAARMSSHAVPEPQAAKVRRQIWEDFDLLLESSTAERWGSDTPVGPEKFPMLPD